MRPADRSACPDEARLLAFHQGDLPLVEIRAIADHLATCRSCEAKLRDRERSDDTIAKALRIVGAADGADTPTADGGPTADEPTSDVGAVIGGRYKLLEPIGEGGMGVVYMARQVEPVRRLVAVKLIKEGMDTRQVLARFEAERQALALMDHPNIARVLDAGASASGRPYFVMELVRGVPITKYCDDHRLTTRERLELFTSACRAIQHAHQKGIIHRDIKPSNVLVARFDGEPVVKVIDFGIAKAVGQPLTDRTLVTNFGAVVGTLEYMSPEQAELNQIDIDTRSDVYTLGVLLYELLTGSTPLDRRRIGQAALFEVLRLVREEEPPRPSTRLGSSEALPSIAGRRGIEPTRLATLIRGDLDWIAMRALEKDRSKRYETANGLARDVERFLNDEPVDASPPSARYRLGKFARKHRKSLRAAVAVAASLVVATALSTWQAVRASRAEAREHAELERSEARYTLARESIEIYYTGASEDVLLKEPRMKQLRGKLLGSALEFYRKLLGELERRGGAAPSPKAQAELADGIEKLAALASLVGDKGEALVGFRRALPLRQALADGPPPLAASRRALARLYHCIGEVCDDVGPPEMAVDWHGRAAAEYQAVASLGDGTDGDRLKAASERIDVGDGLARTVRTEEAATAFDRAIADLRRLATSRPDDFDTRRTLAIALLKAGHLRVNGMPRPLEAIPLIDESNAIHEELAIDHGDDISLRQDWADGLHHAAMCREQVGPIERAIPFFARSFEAAEPVFRRQPTLSRIRRTMADARIGIGIALAELPGRERDSLVEYDRANALLEPLVAENPDVPIFRARLAASESSRGYSFDRLGDFDGAIQAYGKSIALRQRLADDQPTVSMFRGLLGEDLGHLGDVHLHAGRPAEALRAYRRAIALMGDLQGNNIIGRFNLASWLSVASSLLESGPERPDERQAFVDRALALLREIAESGFRDPSSLTGDANFAPLRHLPAYQAILLDIGFPENPFGG